MRKRDLVYLHALLSLVRRWLAERSEEPDGAYDAYDALDVTPTGLDRRKDEHEQAVDALLDGIEATIAAADAVDAPSDEEPAGWSAWNANR